MRTAIYTCAMVVGLGIVASTPVDTQQRRDPPGVRTLDADGILETDGKRLSQLKTQYNLADARISEYVLQSMLSIQQGHRAGFQHFRVWFRDIRNAQARASVSVAQEIIKYAFPKIFDAILPGSGAIAKEVQSALATVAAVDKLLTIKEGDVELFLDRLNATEEERIARLLDMPKQLKQNHKREFDAAKIEYLDLRLQDPSILGPDVQERRAADARLDPDGQSLPNSVVEILNTLGVPAPGSDTARRVAESVLESHILTVMRSDGEWRVWWPYSETEYAKAHALRQIDLAANKGRICEITRSWTYYRIIQAKDCASLPRR